MTTNGQPFQEQLRAAFKELNYPIEDETDLTPNYPSWSSTRFRSGDTVLTARELLLLVPPDFPYSDADELARAIQSRLQQEDYLG